MLRFALAVLLSLASVSPAFAQGSPSSLPAATVPLDGVDTMWVDQGAGCPTNTVPCTSKRATSLRVGNPVQTNCTAIAAPYTYQHCIDTSLGTPVEKIFFNSTWFPFVTLNTTQGPLLSGGLPSPFTVAGVNVNTTAAQLNYLSAATGTTGNTASNLVFSNTPTLTSPVITGGTITGATINNLPVQAPNILVDADMRFDQVFEGGLQTYAALAGGKYMADVWYAAVDSTGGPGYKTQALVADAPPGYYYSVKMTTNSVGTVAATSFMGIEQPIEVGNFYMSQFGSNNASNLCLSFWAKSSIAPYTFSANVRNQSAGVGNAANRAFPVNFTISNSATWTQFSSCFAGDTAGAWNTVLRTEAASLGFYTVTGANFQGTASAWNASDARGTASNTNSMYTTNGATFQIAGAKLEFGSVNSTFVHNTYETDFAAVRRYYEKSYHPGVVVPTGGQSNNQWTWPLWGTTNHSYSFHIGYQTPKRTNVVPAIYSPANGNGTSFDLNGVSTAGAGPSDYDTNGFNWSATFVPTVGGVVSAQWAVDARM